MDRLGDKWSILILNVLFENGVLRFNELMSCIDAISLKVLASTLHTLENEGFVSRAVYPEVPPRVEYRLTKQGRDLIPFIQSLSEWAVKNIKTSL